MEIRPARPADIPQIAAVYAHAVLYGTASWEYDPPPEDEMTKRMKTLTDAGFPYLAAEHGGRLLGYAYAGPYRPRAAYRWIVEDSIYIAPDAQRAGVGRRLLGELIAACLAQGRRQMIAVIGDSGSVASVALHRSLGFEHVGVVRSAGWKFNRWLDQVLMQRSIGEGDEAPPKER